jgi:hypothetical protein
MQKHTQNISPPGPGSCVSAEQLALSHCCVYLTLLYMLHPARSGNPNQEPTRGSDNTSHWRTADTQPHANFDSLLDQAAVSPPPLSSLPLSHCCIKHGQQSALHTQPHTPKSLPGPGSRLTPTTKHLPLSVSCTRNRKDKRTACTAAHKTQSLPRPGGSVTAVAAEQLSLSHRCIKH